jgi:mono/diheme cytochrome c family protein
MRWAGLLVFAAALFALPIACAQQTSDAPPAGNAENGKKLFMSDGCYECHGRQGQGAAQTGAVRIGPPQLSFEGFQSYVRKPTNQMPPYTSKALPDQDLADIYAYLKSIPMPPKGKDIPLLNK